MNKFLSTLLLLVISLAWGVVRAEQVQGLYEAEVPVDDQTAAARLTALDDALSRVLVKVSGNGAVASVAALGEALQHPERYVQQYRYRVRPEPQAAPPGTPPAAVPSPTAPQTEPAAQSFNLWVRFDAEAVNQLLRGAGERVWGAVRPLTLVWLAIDQGQGRHLVASNDEDGVAAMLGELGQVRALPMQLPLLDLEDRSRIKPVDVWGEFLDTVNEASARYKPQAILIGRLFLDSQGWQGRWTLVRDADVRRWDSRGTALEEVLKGGVDGAGDALATMFAQSYTSGGGHLRVEVQNVADLDAYGRVRDYLSRLNGISALQLLEVRSDAVVFDISVDGSVSSVVQTIGLGSVLAAAQEQLPDGPDAERTGLTYRLMP